MVKGLNTVLCQVASVEVAAGFYRDLLGLTPMFISPGWGQFTLPGGGSIGLHPPFGEGKPANGSGWILGLEVDSVVALRRTLEENGHVVRGYHDVPGGTLIEFADIDGNPIQAIQLGVQAKDLA